MVQTTVYTQTFLEASKNAHKSTNEYIIEIGKSW